MVEKKSQIGIRPTSSVYATYRRLSYKAWFAIAEFIDNSTQSFFNNRIKVNNGIEETVLEHLIIRIDYNPSEKVLVIEDNAFGMELDDFIRALVLNSPPKERSGRSEFGMGLKTAACWFGAKWTVETSQLGSEKIYRATMDVEELAKTHADVVIYHEIPTNKESHFTRITISDMHQPIRGRTVNKVREHLASIYRDDLRSGRITIKWNDIPLTFEEPPFYEETDSTGNKKVWRKEVQFSVPWDRYNKNLSVHGWIGIRKQGKQKDAGLVLLRRGRVIIGGPDEGYRPSEVFGQANTFRSQRLIGELHLDEWPVTQAKDGFDWADGLEDSFIEELEKVCKEYGDKAEIIRLQTENRPITRREMENVAGPTVKVFENEEFRKWISNEIPPEKTNEENTRNNKEQNKETVTKSEGYAEKQNNNEEDIQTERDGPIVYKLKLDQTIWVFKLYWKNSRVDEHWMGIQYPKNDEIEVLLNTAHPFISPYIQAANNLELIQKFVIALALAEKIARLTSSSQDSHVDPADFRIIMNKILKRISELEVAYNYG
ncbi:ATP-binding protein [Brevibacillus borstelensis]|uniref:ATP-binding protein n=1 Tax=Brevibacillus borstelensis TaxID=45462 RepID=UPI0004F3E9A3|nr:ATP-binding protein [Brevibacillus borstelensis]KKX55079.1 hypothetical protein X546_10380 [Brevibacillus borstelensis cifa_chp40]MED1884948.1 ATP-binding protein [Brevibacillus borstelensis]RNB65027.1 hypothetical protein EDM54_04845 [Brevibacillus borstelensis]GED55296.1 hypothetical protein BBO01nite_45370 [Brevibacillus borstelensis]